MITESLSEKHIHTFQRDPIEEWKSKILFILKDNNLHNETKRNKLIRKLV